MSTNENKDQKIEEKAVELTEEQTEAVAGGRTKWDGPHGSEQIEGG